MRVIYLYTNMRNGMQYVGQTNNLERRDREHKVAHGKTYFEYAYRKHPDEFKLEIIRSFHDDVADETINDWEIYFIAKLNTKVPNGYNLTEGGGGRTGYNHSDETRAKMSESMKGKNTWTKGRKHSAEAKAKISKAHKGKTMSAEARQHMSNSGKGKHTGSANGRSKPCICEELNMTFESASLAASWLRENGWPKALQGAISSCCRGDLKTAYGYHWRYI